MNGKLSLKAFTKASAVLWGACALVVGLINLARPAYGLAFLNLLSSVYPGYHGPSNIVSVLVLTGYALVDGAIGGFLFALIYNGCVTCCQKSSK